MRVPILQLLAAYALHFAYPPADNAVAALEFSPEREIQDPIAAQTYWRLKSCTGPFCNVDCRVNSSTVTPTGCQEYTWAQPLGVSSVIFTTNKPQTLLYLYAAANCGGPPNVLQPSKGEETCQGGFAAESWEIH